MVFFVMSIPHALLVVAIVITIFYGTVLPWDNLPVHERLRLEFHLMTLPHLFGVVALVSTAPDKAASPWDNLPIHDEFRMAIFHM